MDLGISGRIALVTGAGRGLGKATARALAREGAVVAIAARTVLEIEEVAASIVSAGGRALAVSMDVGDPESVREGHARVERDLGAVGLLAHCAASFYAPTRLHNLDDAMVDELVRTDALGGIHAVRAALPSMMKQGFGRIVLVGSLAATHGVPGGSLYGMAKAGFEGLAAGVSLDYARYNIVATALRVGFMTSERFEARMKGDPARRERLRNLLPTRRLPSPEEVAQSVLFLSSDVAWTVAGATLTCAAGGQLAAAELAAGFGG